MRQDLNPADIQVLRGLYPDAEEPQFCFYGRTLEQNSKEIPMQRQEVQVQRQGISSLFLRK